MFNDHSEIVEEIEDTCYDIFYSGKTRACNEHSYSEYKEYTSELVSYVQQRLEYMQSQIDNLMLEYCPEELSQEQLDNWAKNQVALSEEDSKRTDRMTSNAI